MSFDLIIRNGQVVDGMGSREAFKADVGVSNGQISAVDDLSDAKANLEIDAGGHIVSPGFIDVHVHSETALVTEGQRFAGVAQGVTTQLLAPDGFGWACLPPDLTEEMWEYTRFASGNIEMDLGWPTIEDYLVIFPGNSPCNVYPQVPHCAVRLKVCGWEPGPATDQQIEEMADLTRQWMEAGAGCLNLGLDYQPSVNADLRELVALCKVAESYGGIYAAHIRNHTLGRAGAWEETFELQRLSGIPIHISHERVDNECEELLGRAEKEGIDISFEAYLYAAGMSHMTIMIPVEDQQGSPAEVIEHLRDPEVKKRIVPYLTNWLGKYNQVVGYTRSGRFIGRTLTEVAQDLGKTPEECAYDLIVEEEGLSAYIFPWQVSPEEADETIARTIRHPLMMAASDGIYNVPHPHPRGFGCFAQIPGKYVREKKLVTLEQAIYKMSGFPAMRFGISDRGEIAKGKVADLVIFDPDTVNARATYEEPTLGPVGIEHVFVNGVATISNGEPTGALPGQVVRH
tara:strand:+ start:1042 stop:2583 length:1542 start_codon:yes stop_codon:yes gene_type:complete